MANKKYKLTDGNYWATDGIHDFGQNKTQREINAALVQADSDLSGAITSLQNDFSGATAISAESGLFTTSKFFRTTANVSLGSTGVTLPAYSRGLVISNTGVTGAIIATEYSGKTIVLARCYPYNEKLHSNIYNTAMQIQISVK